ncbi:MAG: type II/IV secretion system ATPase subunit [Candidatus Micrarchaeia archaeon]
MKILAKYAVECEGVLANVVIYKNEGEFVKRYETTYPLLSEATKAAIGPLKETIVESIQNKVTDLLDPREAGIIKNKLKTKAAELVEAELGTLNEEEEKIIIGRLSREMLGLGDLELLLADEQLEEIAVNTSGENVRVYHKTFGWLTTNVTIQNEEQIHNYSSSIGRKVGKQITLLNPLMDAHLLSGNRVNATMFPISSKGNTLTIRKFAKEPWTIVSMIENNTLNLHLAALLWLSIRYEMNILVSGGTASGKTSFLNSMLAFVPSDQRLLTLEDTRELQLPDFLHWTPMSTRQANPEGKGEVSLLDLLVNALRMRPDRIVLGEIRRKREAEVLFEAMHTGHSVCATLHAEDSVQVRNRLVNPPIELPEAMLGALQLIVVQYRQRRTGIRRTFEVSEVVPYEDTIRMNVIYRWDARKDELIQVGEHLRLINDLTTYTGMTKKEIEEDLSGKKKVLANLVENKIKDVNSLGRIIDQYYESPDKIFDLVDKKKNLKELLK